MEGHSREVPPEWCGPKGAAKVIKVRVQLRGVQGAFQRVPSWRGPALEGYKLQLGGGAAWEGVQPGGMLPLRDTSQRISARRDESEGLHPRGEHLGGRVPKGRISERIQSLKHHRGARGSHQLWPKQISHAGYRPGCHCRRGEAKCLWVRAAPGEQLQDYYKSRERSCPKPLRTAMGSCETAAVCPG